MVAKLARNGGQGQDTADALKGWAMVVLTFAFVLLYVAALAGLLKPLDNDRMAARLEPIIFVIVGYYFGRLPAQQNERTLKDEVTRQTQRADAALHAREQVQQVRETLEEKVKNARAVLAASVPSAASAKSLADGHDRAASPASDESLRSTVAAAVNVLSS